jgi:hypothetical protein
MTDWRNIAHGFEIPSETYADQPYVVRTDDGAWLCVLTTGVGREGHVGQHVVSMRSEDYGRTWSDPVDVEPADGPEASYAVLLKVPDGRVYCFYNHNTDNIRQVRADDPPYSGGFCRRVDSLGHFVFKYSDDHGRSWSRQRYDIPIRTMSIDRGNPYGGKLCFFWNVGRPFLYQGVTYVSLHKVGGFGEGFFTRSEGVLLMSSNLASERDLTKIAWQTLPDGDSGLRAPAGGGPIAEEQSYVVLSDGTFYAVYRTIDGHPAYTCSRDSGHTWAEPRYMRYGNGRLIKHPRAANFCWSCGDGRYLYWYHNHGGRFVQEHPQRATMSYQDRNPAWICLGSEIDTPAGKEIAWSEPEILLYDDDPFVRISYPDLVQEGERLFVTETQKEMARVHEIESRFLRGLWARPESLGIARDGLVVSTQCVGARSQRTLALPDLPQFCRRDQGRVDYGMEQLRTGITVEAWVRFDSLDGGQVLLDNRREDGKGFCLRTTENGTAEVVLNDGRTQNRWTCDREMLQVGERQHIVAIVDAGPRVISFVVNGVFCDGGSWRQFGWGRFSPYLRDVNGGGLHVGPNLTGSVKMARIYARPLRTFEAVGNYVAGRSTG